MTSTSHNIQEDLNIWYFLKPTLLNIEVIFLIQSTSSSLNKTSGTQKYSKLFILALGTILKPVQ